MDHYSDTPLIPALSLATFCAEGGRRIRGGDQSKDDVVGNSPRVRWELAKGIRSLLGWRKGVRRKKTKTRWKIVKGSRKAYRELGMS
ncbi:hypothetical protein GW17_00046783 [Ensete ventricosum]|nr:hypothetical protein GW17_00046783 [Ensete ventricosum]